MEKSYISLYCIHKYFMHVRALQKYHPPTVLPTHRKNNLQQYYEIFKTDIMLANTENSTLMRTAQNTATLKIALILYNKLSGQKLSPLKTKLQ